MGRGIEPGPSNGPTATAVQCNSFSGINNNFDTSWNMTQDSTKMNKLREMVENTTSATRKCVIDNILQQIAQLSDLEKFLLYLKLPMGRSPEPDPLKQPLNPLGSRSEVQLTITWIKAHLEEDLDVSLFKEDVYRKYLQYSANYQIKHLSKADFGKVMKQVFPKVKARRLGHRGDSRYTYSGLTNKFSVETPILPDLSDNGVNEDRTTKKMPGLTPMTDGEQEKAANSIVLEWAEKKCNLKCSTVTELARELLNMSYVDTNSVYACTLMSEHVSTDASVGKHQLQRKLQEKEHKRKLQQEVNIDSNRNVCERQKSRRRSGLSKMTILDDDNDVTNKNIKNSQPAPLKHNLNNNLEEFITTDNKIDRILRVSPVIKKEIFEIQNESRNNNKDLSSLVGTSITAIKDTGKHFASKVGSIGIDMKALADVERNIDITNGNASQEIGPNLPCHIEDLSHLSGDVHFIPTDINDKGSNKMNTINDGEEFLSPHMIGNDDKINQIRKILYEKKIGQPRSHLLPDESSLDYEQGMTSPGLRRRVSFQSPDGCLVNTTILGGPGQESPLIPTRILGYTPYTPICYAGTDSGIGQVMSHSSSTNPSPFMSPSTTPVHRSRHNSGQTNSPYVTPRSTPFTPDLIVQSENGTPFMSPAPTPFRSRHNSSQNIRAPFTSTSKSRHSSGTAGCRHTPYQDDFSRRKSRNLSGNMPLSAPLSPRIHDITFNTLTDLSCHSNGEAFHGVFRKGNVGIVSSFPDPRKRHVSAGPTIHYQPQPSPGTFSNCSTNTDSLSLEVSNAMSNPQPCQELLTQASSANRPQSVPLLQMNTVAIPEGNFIAKSYPTTPIVNQQFDFGQVSQPIPFASKPALNFPDFSNNALDFSEESIDHTNGNNLAAINPSISTLNNTGGLESFSQTLSTSNISFSENFPAENVNTFTREENGASFLQNVEGASFTSNPLVSNSMISCPQQDPNRTNSAENSCQQVPLHNPDMGFSGNSHITLNALNASPLDFQALDRGFDTSNVIPDDYSQPYSTLVETEDFNLFEVSRE